MTHLRWCPHNCPTCIEEQRTRLEGLGFRFIDNDDPILKASGSWAHSRPDDEECTTSAESLCFDHRTMPGKDHTGLPQTSCPACNHLFDSAMGMGTDERPEPGDYSVCINCGAVLRYDEQLSTRLLSESEWDEMEAENKAVIEKAQRAIAELHQ